MNRIIVTTALLLGTSLAAQAYPVAMYYDLIRPNGHPRSQIIYQSNLNACYRQTGGTPYLADSAAMKKCMLSHGYRFVWQRGYDNGWGRPVVASRRGHNPQPGWSPPPDSPPPGKQRR